MGDREYSIHQNEDDTSTGISANQQSKFCFLRKEKIGSRQRYIYLLCTSVAI